jgi:hypothetical protein
VYEGTVNTSTYPDGPNLPSDLRSRIKVALDTDDAAVKAPQGPNAAAPRSANNSMENLPGKLSPELMAALEDLMQIVEGVRSERWAADGRRLKDTPEWCRLYVLRCAILRGAPEAEPVCEKCEAEFERENLRNYEPMSRSATVMPIRLLPNGLVNVEEARKLYGEPEYGYFKQWMQWSPGARRGQAGHYAGSWVECPQDEFEREYDTGRTLEMRRFMKGSNTKDGVRNSYWLYERRLKTPGWVQKLIEELKALEKQATSSPNDADEPRGE